MSEKPVWRGRVPHPNREKEQNSSRSSALRSSEPWGACALRDSRSSVGGGENAPSSGSPLLLIPSSFARAVFYAHASLDQPVPKSRLSDAPIRAFKKSGA